MDTKGCSVTKNLYVLAEYTNNYHVPNKFMYNN